MTVTAGTPFEVNSSAAAGTSNDIALLDSTNAIALYDGATQYKATVIQDDETLGTEFTLATLGFEGNDCAIAALSSTKAISIREGSGDGAGTLARILSISGTTITAPGADNNFSENATSGYAVAALSSTAAIAIVARLAGDAHYLTVSGTTITNESSVNFEAGDLLGFPAICKLTSAKAVVVYTDTDDSNQLKAVVLSVSGVTISAGTPVIIDAGDSAQLPALAEISTTSCLLVYRNVTDGNVKSVVLSGMSGTTVTVNTPIVVDADDSQGISLASYSATEFVAAYARISDNSGRFIELAVSGVTVSTSGSDSEYAAGASVAGSAVAYSASQAIHIYTSTTEAVMLSLSVDTTLGLAAMTKPADVDAAGEYIYVALLEGGTPILTKISTALDADGTTVFDPGTGDNIGVECGRFNSDVIWVAGNFDGTNVVEKSEDGGSTFTVKDDATIGDVRTFVIGPDSDERIIVFDETNGDFLETFDNGETWTTINAAVTPEVNAIARLGKNVQESVFGNAAGGSDSIDYSVNSGGNLEDYQTGVYPSADATRVIIN